MQSKKSEAAETRGSDSAFFFCAWRCAQGSLRVAWTTCQCRFNCWSCCLHVTTDHVMPREKSQHVHCVMFSCLICRFCSFCRFTTCSKPRRGLLWDLVNLAFAIWLVNSNLAHSCYFVFELREFNLKKEKEKKKMNKTPYHSPHTSMMLGTMPIPIYRT